MRNRDAFVRQDGTTWVIGTASVEKLIAFEDGRLLMKSFINKLDGQEMMADGIVSDEFFYLESRDTDPVTGSTGGWSLVGSKEAQLRQGELQLDITVSRNEVEVTKSYVIHPGSSVIREWVSFTNTGTSPIHIVDPGFLSFRSRLGDPELLDLHWMTGGECQPDSWKLRTESLTPGEPRGFDSYDPFPLESMELVGDGVDVKALCNDTQVWPAEGWQYAENAYDNVKFDFDVEVSEGDRLVFLLNKHETVNGDTTTFDPTITYEGGESHTASKEFSDVQGGSGWRYESCKDGVFTDLVFNAEAGQWRPEDPSSIIPFIGPGGAHPGEDSDAARVWAAPRAGRVKISGNIINVGNWTNTKYAPRPGTGSYAPWCALYNGETSDGIVIGWDYFGHWASSFVLDQGGSVVSTLKVANYDKTLEPGESVTTPKAFTAVFREDLDNAGNELLDWQYEYMWDYAREGWFPAIRMLGYWWRGTGWMRNQYTGYQDIESCINKVFHMVDFMRYTGGDVYHRDWGWWDKAGDWYGPDWRVTDAYLDKYGMGQLIYAYIYGVDADSKVALEHPEWVRGGLLDMSKPEVVSFLKNQLDSFADRWGTFEWRTDGGFTVPLDGDDTPLLGQDQGFRDIIRSFLDKHPDCAFQACNGGGNYAGYDYVRLSSCIQMTDGAVGIRSNYYTSLLLPPEKTCHMPDYWDPAKFDKATWRGLLSLCFDMSGETFEPEKIEGLRELIDIYHYLLANEVAGRWVKVYRPIVTGDDPVMYFQRMSRDAKRGIIITKHLAEGPVTIKPKGLIADEQYEISFQESDAVETLTGADLMQRGLSFESLPAGELIYLNLSMHPGSKLDTLPPSAPSQVRKHAGTNVGYPGIELFWEPGTDNNWVSYYEVLRDGKPIDKVAKGTYYFDHSAGADLAAVYEIRTVDGSGNVSSGVLAKGPDSQRASILDSAPGAGILYAGEWKHESGILTAHEGTLSSSNAGDAYAEITFEGKRVLWFTRLGADCGKAAVSIDGGEPEIADTYSADDMLGVCAYSKDFGGSGRHTIRIAVLDERRADSTGSLVYVDAIRVEH